MNTRQITIPTPCFAAWDAMTPQSDNLQMRPAFAGSAKKMSTTSPP